MTEVKAELWEGPKGLKMDVQFNVYFIGREPTPETQAMLDRIRSVSGATFDKERRVWVVPADWHTALELRDTFGRDLTLGPRLKEWGRTEKARQSAIKAAADDDNHRLEWLQHRAPDLYEAVHLGPRGMRMTKEERAAALSGPPSFQAADVRFMVETGNPLNANHMGLGKTLETIAAVIEGRWDEEGPVLVVAPVSAAEGTWPEELRRWQEVPAWLARGTARRKQETHEEFLSWVSPQPTLKGQTLPGNPGWLIVNPEQIQLRETVDLCPEHEGLNHKTVEGLKIIKACSAEGDRMDDDELIEDPRCLYRIEQPYPILFDIEWSAVIYDEAHEHGILNPKSLTGRGARALKTDRSILLTGTPMGGKEIRMFEILQFLHPKVFTSKWKFAERYLEINTKEFYKPGGRGAMGISRTIGGIKRCEAHREAGVRPAKGECLLCDNREQTFFRTLNPYVLRRTKEEVLTDLPPKQHVDLWVPFASDKHRKQYETFAADAEARIGETNVTATNVISEYTRLGQLAWGLYDTGMVPTATSGKLRALDEKLLELGVYDPSGAEQAVIFSQYKTIVDLVHLWLVRERLGDGAVGKLHGGVTARGARAALKEAFQGDGRLRVLVVSTKAGGTSLTLDRASNVFILDETWNPDNEEQAEDRCHRASRIHQVTVYRLLTRGTIDEYKREIAWEKAAASKNVMDLRRIKLRSEDG